MSAYSGTVLPLSFTRTSEHSRDFALQRMGLRRAKLCSSDFKKGFVCWLVGPSNMLVYLRVGSIQTVLRAGTPR